MGFGNIWHLDLLRMLRKAPWPWRSLIVRAFRVHGQMERYRIGKNEGKKFINVFSCMNCIILMYSLELLQVGGNQRAREFLDSQPDYDDTMSIQQKYNTKAAALYRDKISTLAQGKSWSIENSSAQNYTGSFTSGSSHQHSNSRNGNGSAMNSSKSHQDFGGGYQDGESNGGYQNFNAPEFRDQKDMFFNRIQEENASRPE